VSKREPLTVGTAVLVAFGFGSLLGFGLISVFIGGRFVGSGGTSVGSGGTSVGSGGTSVGSGGTSVGFGGTSVGFGFGVVVNPKGASKGDAFTMLSVDKITIVIIRINPKAINMVFICFINNSLYLFRRRL
jgi:hypothetical protein